MWYYIEGEQQRGPVVDADLEALRREGKISSETMVWREGMANWQPLGEISSGGDGNSTPPRTPPSTTPTPLGSEVVCSQCGGIFPASEVIRYSGSPVCAACKPIFVQKLKEGAKVGGGTMEFAQFGTRFAAYFVDGIITAILGMVVGAVIGGVIGATGGLAGGRQNTTFILIELLSAAAGLGVRAAYYIFFIGHKGQTPGKMLCKIKVVNADGSPVSYAKATGRFFGYMLSALILCIGFLMAAWDEEKRALHDRLCGTRVVKV